MSVSDETQQKARSPFAEAADMFLRNYAAVAGLFVLVLIVLAAVAGPLLYPGDPFNMAWVPFTPPGQ
ncbi:MAG: ABC transporter permease, partial [Pseudomonadota bacterium]